MATKNILTNMPKMFLKKLEQNNYLKENSVRHGFDMATEVGIKAPGFKDFFISGFKTVVDMWFVILPVVMSIGTIATIIANYTPIFEIVGKPFVPF